MRRLSSVVLALAVICFLAHPARGDLIYTYTTTSAAPLAGPVSGSFVVADAAIVDGFIIAAEIQSYDFVLPLGTLPYAPALFAPPDALTIFSPFSGAISVNPVTGDFTLDALISVVDAATQQTIFLTTTSIPDRQYDVILPSGEFALGSGGWTTQRTEAVVPEPHSLALAGAAGICALIWHRFRRNTGRAAQGGDGP